MRPILPLCLLAAALGAAAPGAHAQDPAGPSLVKRNVYGVWSRDLFADAAVVERPLRLIFVSGMAAEDPQDGHIHAPGDFAAQCRMSYEKIKKILAEQGADMGNIVRTVAYLTDMRDKEAYVACQKAALGDAPLPPHTLLGVSSLAWPGMMVEVEVTAARCRHDSPRPRRTDAIPASEDGRQMSPDQRRNERRMRPGQIVIRAGDDMQTGVRDQRR